MASVDLEFLGRIVARLIERVSLFKGLTQAELLQHLARARMEEVAAGDVVMREGESSAAVFVILRGSVEVARDANDKMSAPIGILGAGECFGEMALVDRLPRSASVTAREKTLLCVLPAQSLAESTNVAWLLYANLAATLAQRCDALESRLAGHLQAHCRDECLPLIVASAAPPVESLDARTLDELEKLGRVQVVAAGQQIVKSGTTGENLYVILEGEAEVSRCTGSERQRLALLGRGHCFGEVGMLRADLGRIADVFAIVDSRVLRIEAKELRKARPGVMPVYQYLARMLSVRLRGFNQIYEQLANADCISDCPFRTEPVAA